MELDGVFHSFLSSVLKIQWRKDQFSVLSVRPLILIKLRVLLRVAVLNCNASGKDGGYVVPHRLPLALLLLLLLLLLDFLQLDA